MFKVNCERIEDVISPFVDGEVTIEETETIISHLRLCRNCTLIYEELCQIKSQLSSLPKVFPKRNIWKNIINHDKQKIIWLKVPLKSSASHLWKKWGTIAASFIVMFFLFVTAVGYFTTNDQPYMGLHDEIVQLHAFHCERQPLSNRMLSGNSSFEQSRPEGD